ncbi:MAG: hypothetical protein CXR30_11465 [Geobacter sp.]|nr:MAG: hypothetical protein CXR30_11465 [Geobacter sp.]
MNNRIPATYTRHCWCGGSLDNSPNSMYARCMSCGTFVSQYEVSTASLKDFYSLGGYWHDYQKKVGGFPDISQRSRNDRQDRIPFWFNLLSLSGCLPTRLLEVGCSHGGFLDYCREHGIGEVVGVEVDEETCAFARQRFQLEHVHSGLFPDVQLPFVSFGAICMFDVVEHFPDPIRALKVVAGLLADDGVLILQTPCYRGEDGGWSQFKPEEHLYLYDESNLTALLDRCGLYAAEIFPGYFRDDMFVVARKKSSVADILFIRTDAIGDNVLASSMLPAVTGLYPGARITVLCRQHISELYETCPFVSKVLAFDFDRACQDDSYRDDLLAHLQSLSFDLTLVTQYSRDMLTDIFAIGSFARERIAFSGDNCEISPEVKRLNDGCYTRLIDISSYSRRECDRLRDYLVALGMDSAELTPSLWTIPADGKLANNFFRQHALKKESTVAICINGSHSNKMYPYYAEALGNLCQQESITLIALGGRDDFAASQAVLNKIGGPHLNLCGLTTLRQSAEILRRCRMLVSADTGTAHLACAVGARNLVVMWGGHFGRFFPYSPLTSLVCLPLECYECNWQCPHDRWHCIREITPATVAIAMEQTFMGGALKPRIFVQNGLEGENGRLFAPDRLSLLGNLNSVEIITVDL